MTTSDRDDPKAAAARAEAERRIAAAEDRVTWREGWDDCAAWAAQQDTDLRAALAFAERRYNGAMARAEAAEAQVQRVEAEADRWERLAATDIGGPAPVWVDGHLAGLHAAALDLRAALAGSGEQPTEVQPGQVDDEPTATPRTRRLRACVERWSDAEEGRYDPACCRFPKSCSANVYDPERVTDADLEEA